MAAAVTEDVWSESNTTPDAIANALRRLLHQRHAANQALAPARVLNLIVVVDRDWKREIANRLAQVGRYHASRTILCAVEHGRTTLDAWAAISYEEPRSGLGVMLEQVEIDLGPGHLKRLDTIIDPIIISDLPTMLWSPHGHQEAIDALLDTIDVMLLDSDDMLEPAAALLSASELLRAAYVGDVAWLRTTPWRERLAASFDPPNARNESGILSPQIRERDQFAEEVPPLAALHDRRGVIIEACPDPDAAPNPIPIREELRAAHRAVQNLELGRARRAARCRLPDRLTRGAGGP